MNNFLVFCMSVFFISCGKPMKNMKNERFNYPNEDFDFDGISNIDEVVLGQSPYVNTTLVNNYLGENSISMSVKLRSNKDHSENLNFLNLEQSINLFDDNTFVKPVFSKQFSNMYNLKYVKQATNKKLYFLNTLGCISKNQIHGLKIKYGNFSVRDVDIFSNLTKYKEFKNTNFYIYDFNTIQDIYFFNSSRNPNLTYQSHKFDFSSQIKDNGFCILYENHSRPIEVLSLTPIFNFQKNKISKKFVTIKYLNGPELVDSLQLGGLLTQDNLYYDSSEIDLNKYSSVKNFNHESVINPDDIKVGDYLVIKRFTSSNIKNRSQVVGSSTSYINRYSRENPYVENIKNGCIHYQKPKANSSHIYRNIDHLNFDEFNLHVGKVLITPKIINGFYSKYSFRVTEQMISNGLISFNFSKESKQKFKFESVLYKSANRGSCKASPSASSYNDTMDFKNIYNIEKTGSL